MNTKQERRASLLLRLRGPGVLVLGGLLFAAGLYRFRDRVIPTGSSGERKLPIYCVQTDEPKVALSFDAAWGGGKQRQAAAEKRRHPSSTVYLIRNHGKCQ